MKAKITYLCLALLSALSIFSSCQKDASSSTTTTSKTTTTTATTSSTGTIAITSLASTSLASTASSSTDSLYLVNCFSKHSKKDTVAFSALPAAIGTYLTANYSGYSFKKAYKITDSLSVITNYIVVIKYNGSYIGLKFTAAGVFVSVLEQRDGPDLEGRGWHEGGPFGDRDGHLRDTIALSAIPSAVKTYFTTNYPADTLLHAYETPDTTYILISKDTLLYATDITAAGKFVKRVQIEKHGGIHTAVTQANLLASISTYLTTTYPGYVFNKAYSESIKGVVTGYDVFITVNSTNYVIDFSSAGVFVKAMAIH